MKHITTFTLCIFLFVSHTVLSLTVDLREPIYSDGVLRTDKGGVITAPDLRIQAQQIIYTHQEIDGTMIIKIEAEEDLILEYGDYVFVGRRLEYDFQERKGVLYDGRTAIEPWFFGGREIHLRPDGSYMICHGYATTSENYKSYWQIESEQTVLREHRYLTAKNVKFRFISLPLFWMPSFRLNLDSIFDSPIRYTARWGGTQGPRVGMSYAIFSNDEWKSFLRLDYRLNTGVGGGFELDYRSLDRKKIFRTANYIAEDKTRFDRKERTRYRFQGVYDNFWDCDRSSFHLSYDKLSDKEMATDYADRGLRLEAAKRTQLVYRRQEDNWILNFLARFRINNFQTIKQELPTLAFRTRPRELGCTGIISENRVKLSYLEFEYTDKRAEDVHDFNSPRYELSQTFYRPLQWNHWNITPEARALAIYYENNSENFDRWMTIGLFQVDANTDLYRYYSSCKHVITPYLRYQYYTCPTTPPDDHFIFDIDDGWYRLNLLRSGITNNWYTKNCDGCIYRKIYSDIYTYAFFNNDTFSETVPKAYGRVVYNFTPYLRSSASTAWDFQNDILDHLNFRFDWTVNCNLAFSAEYRHRSAYDWRKLDRTNFILDVFKDVEELRNSSVSDRRDTILFHAYYRFHYNWAIIAQSRSGWNRHDEKNYWEYEIDFLGTVLSAGQLRFSFRHREDDDRFTLNFNIGLKRPSLSSSRCCSPCLEF